MTTYATATCDAKSLHTQIAYVVSGIGSGEDWIEAIHLDKDEAFKHAAHLESKSSGTIYQVVAWSMLASAPPE